MKNREELNAIKEEVKALGEKLAELSEDELEQVTGGSADAAVLHNMPKINGDEKYVMVIMRQNDDRKYEIEFPKSMG